MPKTDDQKLQVTDIALSVVVFLGIACNLLDNPFSTTLTVQFLTVFLLLRTVVDER